MVPQVKTYTRCLYFAQTINLVRKKHIQGVPNFCRNLKLSEGKHIVHCVVPILNQLTNILENYKGVLHYSVNFLNIHNGKSNKKEIFMEKINKTISVYTKFS